MQNVRERAKHQFPSVLLTLLSIIQALALEVLWSSVHDHPHLWAGGFPAFVGWLQVATVLGGIVLVWLVYVSIVLRVVWVPSVGDTVYPFIIGVMEFWMADMLGPEHMHIWFFLLAALFAISTRSSMLAFKAARRDPINDELFAGYSAYSTRDRNVTIGFVGTLVLSGVVVLVFGSDGWVALGCLVAALATLAGQYWFLLDYWNRSLGDGDGGGEPHAEP
jgi:hypothetical protein